MAESIKTCSGSHPVSYPVSTSNSFLCVQAVRRVCSWPVACI